jgi:hypothetical protein
MGLAAVDSCFCRGLAGTLSREGSHGVRRVLLHGHDSADKIGLEGLVSEQKVVLKG